MIATRDLKDAASIRKNAFLDVFHPGSIHADRNRILGLARHRAGVASDAFAVIDYEAVFHSLTSFADVIRRCHSPKRLDLKQSIIRASAQKGSVGVEPRKIERN